MEKKLTELTRILLYFSAHGRPGYAHSSAPLLYHMLKIGMLELGWQHTPVNPLVGS